MATSARAAAAPRGAPAVVSAARMPTAPHARAQTASARPGPRPEVTAQPRTRTEARPQAWAEAQAGGTAAATDGARANASRDGARPVGAPGVPRPSGAAFEGTCAVCLEHLSGAQRGCSFQCAHVLCADCDARLERIGDHRCPTCRAPRIGYSAQEAERAAAARFAPDTSRDRAIAQQHAAGHMAGPTQQRAARRSARDVGERADGRSAPMRATASDGNAPAAEEMRASVARGVAVVAAEGVAPSSMAVGVPVAEARAPAEEAAAAAAPPRQDTADSAEAEVEAEAEVQAEAAAVAGAEATVGAEAAAVEDFETEDVVTSLESSGAVGCEEDVALESPRHALGEADKAQAAGSRRTLAILRWRTAAFWAVSLAARRQTMSAVSAAAAERLEATALHERVVAAAEEEAGRARAKLEALTLAELEALTMLQGERRERARERANSQAALMSIQAELDGVRAELSKAQKIERSGAAAAASRIATAAAALAEGMIVGTDGTQTSPIREASAAAARWPEAAADEHCVRSAVACQAGCVDSEPAPTPIGALRTKSRGARRRWLLLSCGSRRVEPWD